MAQDPAMMYRWRRLTAEQREEVLKERQLQGQPRHSVPHYSSDTTTYYMITAACFEHRSVIGRSANRMVEFESELVELLSRQCSQLFAWNVLPNHYHVLLNTPNVRVTLRGLGQLHGRNSYYWNLEEKKQQRQVWCNAAETAMKSESHFYASLNYVLHNAVHHGYVRKWIEWPWCSASQYLDERGREEALRIWNSYPLYDYGKDWDPPEM